MRHNASYIPKHTLSIKYLRMLMPPAELADLLRRYVEVKIKELAKCKECAGYGDIKIVDAPARQDAGGVRDEDNHYETCGRCNGSGRRVMHIANSRKLTQNKSGVRAPRENEQEPKGRKQ